MANYKTSVNTESAEWRAAMRELTAERDRLREELEGFPLEQDRSNFLRGRLFEINRLINLDMNSPQF